MATLYNTGHITVNKGATKVYGADTAWLAAEIKAHDLIYLGGCYYEIAAVDSSTEITLTYQYAGSNITTGDYSIMKIARQVITAELYEEISNLIEKYKKRDEIVKYAAKFLQAGLRVDDNNNIYQTAPSPTPIEGEFATDDEIHALIHDVMD